MKTCAWIKKGDLYEGTKSLIVLLFFKKFLLYQNVFHNLTPGHNQWPKANERCNLLMFLLN